MKRQVGKVSLSLLCLVAGGLWLIYKLEYLQLLLATFSGGRDAGFDVGAEQRLLLFILSPGLLLLVVGIVMLIGSWLNRPKSTRGPIVT